jgi:hypothetical protein
MEIFIEEISYMVVRFRNQAKKSIIMKDDSLIILLVIKSREIDGKGITEGHLYAFSKEITISQHYDLSQSYF